MNKALAFLLLGLWISYIFVHPADRAVMVHNTLQDLEKCKGKLSLKLIVIRIIYLAIIIAS